MKKLIAILLALTMILALAACGSSAAPAASAPAASNAGSAAADSDAVFYIGAIGPLTGVAAIYGNAVANAAQIAVDEINAAGGINGYQIAYKATDDVHDAETSVNAYNSLMDWGMQVLIGPVTSTPGAAVAAVAYEERTFCLSPSASSSAFNDGKDNAFQVCFTDPNQGIASADYIADNLGGGKVAVIYQNDDNYSQGIRDTFTSEAAAKGLDIVYDGPFTADTATDFSVQLTAAKTAGAETIFLPIYYTPASVILKQADEMGYAPTFFGVDGMDGILSLEGFDVSLAEDVLLLTPFAADAQDDLTKAFVAKYKELYTDIPNQFAADAYDCVYVLKAAMEKADCTPDMSPEEICEALIGVMTTISIDGLTGEGMTWNAKGEVNKAPRAVVIKDGAYVNAG